uniref:Inositolphosphotransferase Aur1/Ipt1 domain-containing protein n=1 Tax=uncultured marine group II/III euryarchaeote KM3_153_G11 TaxID=1457896 RepID=A0A075GEI0_9EURY|nr:hypothetical protein [uncultured marine group II/III euryarchaeote KM3_153_G11]
MPQFLELVLFIGAYLVYVLTRGLVYSDTDQTALENAQRVVAAERSLGFLWEPGWQAWALDNAVVLVRFLNWAYIITYWPIVLTLVLVGFVIDRPLYYYYRTVIMINLAFALAVFMVFPVSSPFDIPAIFVVDTIQDYGPAFYGSPEMAIYYNTNAAMPSLHFSWTVILGVLFVRSLKGWLKLLGLAYPVMTLFAITITGNHFILDAIAGGILAGMAFAVMELGVRRRLSALWRQTGSPRR